MEEIRKKKICPMTFNAKWVPALAAKFVFGIQMSQIHKSLIFHDLTRTKAKKSTDFTRLYYKKISALAMGTVSDCNFILFSVDVAIQRIVRSLSSIVYTFSFKFLS